MVGEERSRLRQVSGWLVDRQWGAKRKRKLFSKREEQTQWVVGMTDKCRGTEKEDVIDAIQ